MIIAPLLIYGSAWENDMDFSQFAIMFKSLYFEGFSRPQGGVRTIIDLLVKRFEELGGELRYRCQVESIKTEAGKVCGVVLKNGEFLESNKVLSSAGLPETFSLVHQETKFKPQIGKLSFTESIFLLEDKAAFANFDSTIVFYNSTDKYKYQKPNDLYDISSAVFCLPDNYERENLKGRGIVRVTNMANYQMWKALDKQSYKLNKEKVFASSVALGEKILCQSLSPIFSDVFTPTTVERYTNHIGGTVYGSTTKLRNGVTEIKGLFVIGTDQGFLGIVGSILSGISMANLHGLMES